MASKCGTCTDRALQIGSTFCSEGKKVATSTVLSCAAKFRYQTEQMWLNLQSRNGPRTYDLMLDQPIEADEKRIVGFRIWKSCERGANGRLEAKYHTLDLIGSPHKKITAEPSQDPAVYQVRTSLSADMPNLAATFAKYHTAFSGSMAYGNAAPLMGPTYIIDYQVDSLSLLPFFIQNLLGRPT